MTSEQQGFQGKASTGMEEEVYLIFLTGFFFPTKMGVLGFVKLYCLCVFGVNVGNKTFI